MSCPIRAIRAFARSHHGRGVGVHSRVGIDKAVFGERHGQYPRLLLHKSLFAELIGEINSYNLYPVRMNIHDVSHRRSARVGRNCAVDIAALELRIRYRLRSYGCVIALMYAALVKQRIVRMSAEIDNLRIVLEDVVQGVVAPL